MFVLHSVEKRIQSMNRLRSCSVNVLLKCRQQFPGGLEKRSHYFRLRTTAAAAAVVSVAKCFHVILKNVHLHINTYKRTRTRTRALT